MRLIFFIFFFASISTFISGQTIDTHWYSESSTNGVRIQNSFPKGGSYTGPAANKFNCSYLVFFSRIINETSNPLEVALYFTADSIPIPNSPGTYMKLFLPSDTMTMDKQSLFSYGITELASLNKSTKFKRSLNPNEDCLFYVVALFYQTETGKWSQKRGGNRAELVLNGQDFFYKLPPQVPSLSCGNITFSK
ncbi:MAG: hypothetical protein R3345_01150 [Fulvivirga sp.]|nr:hypothetical protein [Fulvivirga sp.]